MENVYHDFKQHMHQATDIAVDFLTDITKTETSQDNEVEKWYLYDIIKMNGYDLIYPFIFLFI